ncbi:MAG: penicillin-binding protein 2, partial [Alphaproteobacteria bacterium]|nr:penicillin-binding protein 2 [Alphaproteobacteria bacterium]
MILRNVRQNIIHIEGEQSSALQLAYGRLILLGSIFALLYLVIAARTIDLMIVQGYASESGGQDSEDLSRLARSGDLLDHVRRGNIYDRNGVLLATSLKTPSLYADPELILNKPKVAKALTQIFPDLKEEETLAKISMKKSRYAWLRPNLSPGQQEKVLELGEPGLAFEYADSRIYPQGNMAAHLLGYTDREGRGLSGIERSAQKTLAQGQDVVLTIDVRLQHALRREIQSAVEEFSAQAGAGVILDVRSGEVLAGVSLPDYDLNANSLYVSDVEKNKEILLNRLTMGVYEFGSVFKIFTTAALLETTDAPLDTEFDARKPLKIGRYTINDYHAKKRLLTVPEVFMYSSN